MSAPCEPGVVPAEATSWRPGRARVMGYLRAAVGAVLIVAPRAVGRIQGDPADAGNAVLLLRTIGIRDLVLGAGTVAAAHGADEDDVRRWVTAGLLSDTFDVAAGAAAGPLIGMTGAFIAATVPLPFVLGDLWALGHPRAVPFGQSSARGITGCGHS